MWQSIFGGSKLGCGWFLVVGVECGQASGFSVVVGVVAVTAVVIP